MKSAISIGDLKSNRARNLLRGVIRNSNRNEVVDALVKIRLLCSETDFKLAFRLIRSNLIFKNNPLGSDFNKIYPSPIDLDFVYSAEEIFESLQRKSQKLLQLGELVERIILSIVEFDLDAAFEGCLRLIENDGVSVFVLRILYLIRSRITDDPNAIEKVDHILVQIKTENLRHLSLVIRELSSNITDYFNIRDKINNSDHNLITCIAKNFIDHVPRTEEIYLETLNAYYRISLLDVFLYQYSVLRLNLPFVSDPKNESLRLKFRSLTSGVLDFEKFYPSHHDMIGLDYFRETFLILELESAFSYRTLYGAVYNSIENKRSYRIPLESNSLSKYFDSVSKMEDIGSECKGHKILIDKYVGKESCNFANSCALVYLLEQTDGDLQNSERDFVRLMSVTRDIASICPLQYIESIKLQAKSDELLVVVICLAFIRQKSQIREHELRNILQQVILARFDSSIVSLLAYLYEISPAVTEHLIQTCDETFLSKLFITIKTPNQAIEERACILEWYGAKISDSTFLERAKNLRIDVQISKEKGTIDDSRIYVDPVKFTQWINDQILSNLTLLLEAMPSSESTGVVVLNWDKVKTGLTAYDQLGSIILRCYEEFCTNTIYGIASYLGRRIRHGTLKGTGLTDVKSFVGDATNKPLSDSKEFSEALDQWLMSYENSLDLLRDRYLHINSKSKNLGMISRDFNSPMKKNIANYLVYDIIKSFETNQNGLELPYVITEYCWRIIEEDLASIRKFMMEMKSKYAVFRPEANNEQRYIQRSIQEFCHELNSLTAEKFRIISSWFNKPSIASPSADIALLFKAVVSEIKGFFAEYRPRIEIDEGDFVISGGLYFVIYDALYILIYNAARYGRDDGILKMEITRKKSAGSSSINITISSEISRGTSMIDVKRSIEASLAGDCEDALVIEGRSGIKKLRRMEQGSYIGGVNYEFDEALVHASFDFKVNY